MNQLIEISPVSLDEKVKQIQMARKYFCGLVTLDPTILDTSETLVEAHNYAREEAGLVPDDHFGKDPEVVRAFYLKKGDTV